MRKKNKIPVLAIAMLSFFSVGLVSCSKSGTKENLEKKPPEVKNTQNKVATDDTISENENNTVSSNDDNGKVNEDSHEKISPLDTTKKTEKKALNNDEVKVSSHKKHQTIPNTLEKKESTLLEHNSSDDFDSNAETQTKNAAKSIENTSGNSESDNTAEDAVSKSTSENTTDSGNSPKSGFPPGMKLPEIIILKSQFQHTALETDFDIGTIAISIPSFSAQNQNFIVLVNNKTHEYYYSLNRIDKMVGGKKQKKGNTVHYLFNATMAIGLNDTSHTITIINDDKTKKIDLNHSTAVLFDGDYYVSESVLSNFFDIYSSLSTLTAVFSPKFVQWDEQKALHEMQLKKYEDTKKTVEPKVDYQGKAQFFAPGRVYLYDAYNSGINRFTYNYGAQALYGTLYLSGSIGNGDLISSGYITYKLDQGNIFNMGKDFYTSQYNSNGVDNSYAGLYYGKDSVMTAGYGTVDIRGAAISGERVELFRSGVLLAFQYITGNRYEFDGVKLISPKDNFVVRTYKTDGSFVEKKLSFYSAMGFLKKGKQSTSLGYGVDDTTQKTVYFGETSYGVTPNLTLSIGRNQNGDQSSLSGAVYYKSKLIMPNYSIITGNYYVNDYFAYSTNTYLTIDDKTQLNFGYNYSNLSNVQTANSTLYFQRGDTSYNVNVTGNYVGTPNYSETLSATRTFFQKLTSTTGLTLNQNSNSNSTQINQNFNISLMPKWYLNTTTSYYTQPLNQLAYSVSVMYSGRTLSGSLGISKDTTGNVVTTLNASLPLGLNFLDSVSGSVSSAGSENLQMGKSFILTHPLKKVSSASTTDGWITGRVYHEDKTPYSGGKITVAGRPYEIGADGTIFISNVTPDKVIDIDANSISNNERYALEKTTLRMKLRKAQGINLDFVLKKVKNIFGIVACPVEAYPDITVELYEKGKKIKTTTLNSSGSYGFTNLVSENFTIKFVLSKEAASKYAINHHDVTMNLKGKEWLIMAPPVTVSKIIK